MALSEKLTQSHGFISETTFHIKSSLLILTRSLNNSFARLKRFSEKQQDNTAPVIASSVSSLWSTDDNEQNWILTAGKVQNLRIAAKKLNGIKVGANEVFSFWKHIGKPNRRKGYVTGREIREGCIVPTIAGGLCQLSNALYDAALHAGFDIVERHRHTQIIKGSLAEQDRDATVKWNYIDLRFKSKNAFTIEVELTVDELIVRFRSHKGNGSLPATEQNISLPSSSLNDCYSCGNTACFKNPGKIASDKTTAVAFVLDEQWKEYDEYIGKISKEEDFFIAPFLKSRFFKNGRYNWSVKNRRNVKPVLLPALQRSFRQRLAVRMKKNIFSEMLQLDRKVAAASAKLIPVESTHLIVAQNLLPFLWESGCLGGRTYDVLMSRLPMEILHQRLDAAHAKYPESKTLNDFRAPSSLIKSESKALTQARHIITPHEEIAEIFNNKSVKLNWHILSVEDRQKQTRGRVLFPASAVGRKGAYEMRRLAQELNLKITVAGKAIEEEGFWQGIDVVYTAGDPLQDIGMLVYPAYIEHRPGLLLRALSAGIQVITTKACGLPPMDNLTILPIGDYGALKEAIITAGG